MSPQGVKINELERWLSPGARWQVLGTLSAQAEVEFCTCTIEPLERRHSRDPAVIDYLPTAHTDLDRS